MKRFWLEKRDWVQKEKFDVVTKPATPKLAGSAITNYSTSTRPILIAKRTRLATS